jgi:hypothetical protein
MENTSWEDIEAEVGVLYVRLRTFISDVKVAVPDIQCGVSKLDDLQELGYDCSDQRYKILKRCKLMCLQLDKATILCEALDAFRAYESPANRPVAKVVPIR